MEDKIRDSNVRTVIDGELGVWEPGNCHHYGSEIVPELVHLKVEEVPM